MGLTHDCGAGTHISQTTPVAPTKISRSREFWPALCLTPNSKSDGKDVIDIISHPKKFKVNSKTKQGVTINVGQVIAKFCRCHWANFHVFCPEVNYK